MFKKKLIAYFLILVLAIQMLPVRQVIRYFFIDNPLTEELAHDAKGATKNFRMLDEDKVLHHYDIAVAQHLISDKQSFFQYSETLPALHSVDILTPPPNKV